MSGLPLLRRFPTSFSSRNGRYKYCEGLPKPQSLLLGDFMQDREDESHPKLFKLPEKVLANTIDLLEDDKKNSGFSRARRQSLSTSRSCVPVQGDAFRLQPTVTRAALAHGRRAFGRQEQDEAFVSYRRFRSKIYLCTSGGFLFYYSPGVVQRHIYRYNE